MSSIEEEDEFEDSDELVTQTERFPSTSLLQQQQHASPSVLEWDSELSESEQEFDEHYDDSEENPSIQAANRALQSYIQSCSQTVSSSSIQSEILLVKNAPVSREEEEASRSSNSCAYR